MSFQETDPDNWLLQLIVFVTLNYFWQLLITRLQLARMMSINSVFGTFSSILCFIFIFGAQSNNCYDSDVKNLG